MDAEILQESIVKRLKLDLIGAIFNVNDYARIGDVKRNCVNYGIAQESAKLLRILGTKVDIYSWSASYGHPEKCVKIGTLIIDGEPQKIPDIRRRKVGAKHKSTDCGDSGVE
jgi:hypothetical protein